MATSRKGVVIPNPGGGYAGGRARVFPGVGGGKHAGLWPVLQGRSLSNCFIWVGDVGPDDPECPDPWILPPQGGTSSDR